ncbi:MAG: hypothetical protein AAF297_09925 [Planctomycetota bacterium]
MDRKTKSKRTRGCSECGAEVSRAYRVRTEVGGAWRFVCDGCFERVKAGAAVYSYGGTWTNRRRS